MTGLSVVTVTKSELLSKLRTNRDAHHDEYAEALTGYRAKAIEELESMLAAARDGGDIKRSITAPRPESHTEDYDRIIEMVEMSVPNTTELTQQEFTQYVRDDWGWKAAFSQTASFYK